MMSEGAPAGRDKRKRGAVSAVCMSATIPGVGASEVISQSAPTLCIQVPMFEATAASQRARNSGLVKGCQADTDALALALSVFIDDASSLVRTAASFGIADTGPIKNLQ